jgi:hypothetical protein
MPPFARALSSVFAIVPLLTLSSAYCGASLAAALGASYPSISGVNGLSRIAAPKGALPGETNAVEDQSQSLDDVPSRPSIDRFAQCISFWDPGTHMTQDEWRESCKRVNHGHNPAAETE